MEERRGLGDVVWFFVGAYVLAWGVWGLLWAIAGENPTDLIGAIEAGQFDQVDASLPAWVLYLLTRLIDFSFSIVGVVAIGVTAGAQGLRTLGRRLIRFDIGWGWYALGLLPVFLYAIAAILATENGLVWESDTLGTILFSLGSGLFVSIFLRGAMGEELGLRGFALPRLQERFSPLSAALSIGVLWALWHLPVLIGRDPLSIVAFLLVAVGLSCVFAWLFNGSGGSLVPVLLFHGLQNWEDGFEVLFPDVVDTEWELVSTLALLVLGIVAVVVLARRRHEPVIGLVEAD